MADVFISYAHEDREFVVALCEALEQVEHTAWLDDNDIPPAAEFPPEIQAGIEESDSFVFVLSPYSVAPDSYCGQELEHAVKHAKRLIPVLRRQVDEKAVPGPLQTPNWIWSRERDDFDVAVEKLIEAIDTDLPWVRQHTRLTKRAAEWDEKGRDDSFLLRGTDLQDAERWLEESDAGRAQEPSQLHHDYVEASRGLRERERQEALARKLAEHAEQSMDRGPALLPRSVLLAVESMRRSPSEEGYRALRSGLALLPIPVVGIRHQSRVTTIAFARDGRRIVSGSEDGAVRVFDVAANRELVVVRHGASVTSVTFSPDGEWIATASEDRTACTWDAETGRRLAVTSHDAPVNSVEFSPDGRWLLTASGHGLGPKMAADGTACFWEAASGRQTACLPHTHMTALTFLPFLPESAVAITASNRNEVGFWNPATGESVAHAQHDSVVVALACHPTAPVIAASRLDGKLLLSDMREEQPLATIELGPTPHMSPVAFSPQGRWLAAVTGDQAVRVWQTAPLHEVARVPHEHDVDELTFSPDERLLATRSYSGKIVYLWELRPGEGVERTRIAQDQALAVAFSPDGRWLGSASDGEAAWLWETAGYGDAVWVGQAGRSASLAFTADGRELTTAGVVFETGDDPWVTDDSQVKGIVCRFDAATGRETARIAHEAGVRKVRVSADGKLVASTSLDFACVWDAPSGREVLRLQHEGEVRDLAFGPDGRRLATASLDGTARVWEMEDGRELGRINHGAPVFAVAFSPDGRRVASAGEDRTTRVWDVTTGNEVARVVHEELPKWREFFRLSFSPDGTWVASPGAEKTARVWEAATGQEVACRRYEHSVIDMGFSPDGARLVTATAKGLGEHDPAPGIVEVWEVETQRVVVKKEVDRPARVVAFGPDGDWLAAGQDDGVIRLWNATTGDELGRLEHPGSVNDLSFDADGRRIASTGGETVRLWLWRSDDLLAEACRRLTRNLTPEEWREHVGEEIYRETCPDRPTRPGS